MPNKYERNNPYFIKDSITLKKTKDFELLVPKNAQFRFKKKFIDKETGKLMFVFETPEKSLSLVIDDDHNDVLTDIVHEE